jgi:hypothetical protein
VVSYDHGDDSLQIAPAECAKQITLNPESNEIFLDVNTAQIIPRAPAAGYSAGSLTSAGIFHAEGIATGEVSIEIIDPMQIENSDTFRVTFKESPTRYSVEDTKPVEDILIANIDKFIGLTYGNIVEESFLLTNMDGSVVYTDSVDYELDTEYGRVRAIPGTSGGKVWADERVIPGTSGGSLEDDVSYRATYTYYPIRDSERLDNEESNPVFDGMKIYVKDQPLEINNAQTGWNTYTPTNYSGVVGVYSQGGNAYPADYEFRFSS